MLFAAPAHGGNNLVTFNASLLCAHAEGEQRGALSDSLSLSVCRYLFIYLLFYLCFCVVEHFGNEKKEKKKKLKYYETARGGGENF